MDCEGIQASLIASLQSLTSVGRPLYRHAMLTLMPRGHCESQWLGYKLPTNSQEATFHQLLNLASGPGHDYMLQQVRF